MDEQEFLEIVPHRLMERTFKPMFGEFQEELPSLVSIILKEADPTPRIVVLHRNFQPSSKVYAARSSAWPEIIKSLKALLEGEEKA